MCREVIALLRCSVESQPLYNDCPERPLLRVAVVLLTTALALAQFSLYHPPFRLLAKDGIEGEDVQKM